jgi:hypothetical protein
MEHDALGGLWSLSFDGIREMLIYLGYDINAQCGL